MELKENMYIRTKYGIFKIKNSKICGKGDYKVIPVYGRYTHIYLNQILKSDRNMIYLIEPGDYVNGYKVIDKNYCTPGDDFTDFDPYWNVVVNKQGSNVISEYEIETIVTKEYFEAGEFKNDC